MQPVLELDANTRGRDFVCGDIHGRWDLLEQQLEHHAFDKGLDRLLCVGDLVDRGDESARFEEYLAESWFVSIMGNHEQLAIKAIHSGEFKDMSVWIANGGGWIMQIDPQLHREIAMKLATLPLAIELNGYGDLPIVLIHADLPAETWQESRRLMESLELTDLLSGQQDLRNLLWSRKRFDTQDCTPVNDALHVFYGHSIVDEIRQQGNTSYIDVGSASTGRLEMLDIKQYLSGLEQVT